MRTLSALLFRRKFGSVLDEVAGKRQPITITRANRALVVLVPADVYEEGAGAGAPARERRLRLAAERLTEWRRRHASRLGRLEPVALVRETRSAR
ncbi:MAG: type II toxin-antitoxin system Phd/YefM family antitoxin [Gemmatimonadota bacterium]